MSLQRAAQEIGDLVLRDFAQSPAGGAWCQYLDLQRQNPLTRGLGAQSAYQRWCEPPGEPPAPPPSQEFSNFGGVPCRDYRVDIFAEDTQGNASTTPFFVKGPVRFTKVDSTAGGNPTRSYFLQGGDGVNCPVTQVAVAGSSNTNVIGITARVVEIVPLGGPFPDDEPVPIPPPDVPDPADEPFEITLNVDLGGLEVNVPVVFGPIIFNTFGAWVPISVLPNADFNLPVNINIGDNPRFGIDLDLEFALPIADGPTGIEPVPGAEPVPIPGRDEILQLDCPELDYDRIQRIVENASCCKTPNQFDAVGTFTFETPNAVFNIGLPNDAVIAYISIIPGDNTRAYKLAGTNAEFGHGNASITTSGDAISFERIYVNNHALVIPEALPDKGLRLSLKEGSIASVSVGRFIVPEE